MKKIVILVISFVFLIGLVSPVTTQAKGVALKNVEGDLIELTLEEEKVANQIQSEFEFIFSQRDLETGLFIIDENKLSKLYSEKEDREKVIEFIGLFNEYEKDKMNNNGISMFKAKKTSAVQDCLVQSVAAIMGVPPTYTLAGKTLKWYIKTYDWKSLAKIIAKSTNIKTFGKRALLPAALFGVWVTCGGIEAS